MFTNVSTVPRARLTESANVARHLRGLCVAIRRGIVVSTVRGPLCYAGLYLAHVVYLGRVPSTAVFLREAHRRDRLIYKIKVFSRLLAASKSIRRDARNVNDAVRVQVTLYVTHHSASTREGSNGNAVPLVAFRPMDLLCVEGRLLVRRVFMDPTQRIRMTIPTDDQVTSYVKTSSGRLTDLTQYRRLIRRILRALIYGPANVRPQRTIRRVRSEVFPVHFVTVTLQRVSNMNAIYFRCLTMSTINRCLTLQSPYEVLYVYRPRRTSNWRERCRSFRNVSLGVCCGVDIFRSGAG